MAGGYHALHAAGWEGGVHSFEGAGTLTRDGAPLLRAATEVPPRASRPHRPSGRPSHGKVLFTDTAEDGGQYRVGVI